jgi:hypothetical protein
MASGVNESTNEFPSPSPVPNARYWLTALCFIALTAAAIVMPMLFLGNASGHDFQPHLAGWIEAAAQWRQGIFFPRWAELANSGFGEPRFIFYPPASWMFGAALGSILPWRMVPGAFVWLTLILAGLSMWKLAREWLLPTQAIAAAVLFAANPYHLALVYYRSDFAELLASALFPLMFCGAFGILRDGWRRMPLLACAFALIWLSNAPAAVMATYSLSLILVIACVVNRSFRPLVWGGLAMFAGFGLAAFYLVPAWWEQGWVQIGQAVATTYDPTRNFLFTRVNDPDFVQFNWKISALAVGLILLTGLGIAFSWRQRREWLRVWWILSLLAVACIFLMLPPSALLWRHLPELKFLQFPWRWLLVLSLVFAFFAPVAGRQGHRWLWLLTLGCAIWATGATITGDTAWDSQDVPTLVEDIRAGRGYDGIEGFQPRAAKTDELDDESPPVGEYDPESGEVGPPENTQVTVQTWTAEAKKFDAKTDEPVTLALKLLSYPAWEVRVDGQTVVSETSPQTGQVLVSLGAGTHHIAVQFRRTRDRMVGGVISALFALGLVTLTILSLRGRRKKDGRATQVTSLA